MKVGPAGIETISGAMKRPKKQNGHNHGNYLPSAKELRIRSRFTEVSQAVRQRSKDLMQINADQAAFLAQRDLPDGKKTMKAYLWKVCGDAYDEEHGA